MHKSSNHGLTLLELIITLSILAIITSYGATSFRHILERQQLKAAGETVFADLRFAQSEAIKRNKKVYVTFKKQAENWCYGINIDSPCDCNVENQCQIDNINKIISSHQFKNIALQKARFAGNKDYTAFDPIKGFALANGVKNGTIWLQSKNSTQLAIIVNRMGRVRFCSPTLIEYPHQCPALPR
ncbi:MAG TPA: prepilin-type N-terminal cleavage/methylation domain-containing protein [Gammaproteobacteria bacterium]|nr:prepilin-type N-terminal cleavage/methylation domain-containing protein [Gammaproteobacteria bacterium]